MDKILYTAIIGNYDNLVEITRQDQDFKSDTWEIIKVKAECKLSRKIKLLPHKYLPEHSVSIWTDGNIRIDTDLNEYIEGENYCLFRHPERITIFEEAGICIKFNKDHKHIIEQQIKKYVSDGFYQTTSLVAGGVLIRRNNILNNTINELWCEQVMKYSRRDQLSFNYISWKSHFEFETMQYLKNCTYFEHINTPDRRYENY
jgi:hypothetical protein